MMATSIEGAAAVATKTAVEAEDVVTVVIKPIAVMASTNTMEGSAATLVAVAVYTKKAVEVVISVGIATVETAA